MAKLLMPLWRCASRPGVAAGTQSSGRLHKKRASGGLLMLRIDRAAVARRDAICDSESSAAREASWGAVDVLQLIARTGNSGESSWLPLAASQDQALNTRMRRHRRSGGRTCVRNREPPVRHSCIGIAASSLEIGKDGLRPAYGRRGLASGRILLCRGDEMPRTKKEQNMCRRRTKPRHSAFSSAQLRSSR